MTIASRQPASQRSTIRQRLNARIDADFNRDMRDVRAFIAREYGPTGPVGAALRSLADPANAQDASRRGMLLSVVERANQRLAVLLEAKAGGIQARALKAGLESAKWLTLGDTGERVLTGLGISWNDPDPAALARVVQYANSDAFQAEIEGVGDAVTGLVRASLRREGIESMIRELMANIPSMAEGRAAMLARTLQMTAFRDATALSYIANARILEPNAIRIAARDERTCPACLALHGTPVPIGQRVNDHHNGRCTSVAVIRGTTRAVEPGEVWFERQSPALQQKILGSAGYAAWKAGAVRLSDYAQSYTDPVWGEMIRAASLKGLLGPDAAAYTKEARSQS